MNNQILQHFDAWLQFGGPSAVVIKEFLEPAAGKGAVIFPPTFAPSEDARDRDEKSQYVIDGEGPSNSCLLDTIGSQANRLEPIFRKEPCRNWIPQINIEIGQRAEPVSILELGHRVGDSVARASALAPDIRAAFRAYDAGDSEPMAKLAPTSLIFGAWDSRDTQIKIPRLLESSVRAHNVERLRRAAQYFATLSADEVSELLQMETSDKTQREALSKEGVLDSPAGVTHGGIRVNGDIVRTTILNLTALRKIAAPTPERTLVVRRYILALALIATTANDDLFLRQGCLLVQDATRPMESTVVFRNGKREPASLDLASLEHFAAAAAEAFGVGPGKTVKFDPAAVKALIEKRAEKKQKKAGK